MRSLYRAEVSQTDHWVGGLMDHLRGRKLLGHTAVIFCSDHGYYFGEHGLLGKPLKRSLEKPTTIYEELGHLPLLIRHPSGLAAGKTISGLCQPPDLFATALELAGLPAVEWARGRSLAPRLGGQPGAQTFAVGGCHPHKGKVSCLTVWTEEWCFIYSPIEGLDGSELYHRSTDLTQTKNVIVQNRAVAEQHFKMLGLWLDELGVPAARRKQLLQGAPFGQFNRLAHRLWLWRNRWSYLQQYRTYAHCR